MAFFASVLINLLWRSLVTFIGWNGLLVSIIPNLTQITGMQAVGFVWIMMCWNTTVTFGDSDA